MDFWLRPRRVSPKDTAGLSPADTLDEVTEKICDGLKRASRLIPSGCVL